MLTPAQQQLREPPSTAQLLYRAEALGITIDERRPLEDGIVAAYADGFLVVNSALPEFHRADWSGAWRIILACAISAAEQGIRTFELRWPIPKVEEYSQGTYRTILGSLPVLMAGRHRRYHDWSDRELAAWLEVPEIVVTRWVQLHRAERREYKRWQTLPRASGDDRSPRPPSADRPRADG